MKIFKKKEPVELTIVDNNKELPDFRKITVPDLKQYLKNGYEEIRIVKIENENLKEKLEQANSFKELYEATLVTLEEFKRRDEENKAKAEKLESKIDDKNNTINDLNEIINTYKIREHEVEKMNKEIEEIKEKTKKETISEYKEKIIDKINNLRGSISKAKLFSEIERI